MAISTKYYNFNKKSRFLGGLYGKSATFSPLSLSNLSEWVDFRTLNGTTDGSPISSITGNKQLYTFTSTGSSRPTWAINDGDGHPAIQFDGVNDYVSSLISNGTLYGPDGNFELWFMMKGLSSMVDLRSIWGSGGISQGMTMKAQPPYPRILFYTPGVLSISNNVNLQDDQWHLVRLVSNATTGINEFWVDGVNIGNAGYSGTPTWNTGADITFLGYSTGGTEYWAGSLRHALFFTSVLDSDTANKVATYLNTAV